MQLGVCYYPEHWPQSKWAEDAALMAEMGLSRVRIGEFAWSRIEPEHGRYDWQWLDDAIETLAAAGLQIILGTPTATPPKWLVDQMPDMLAVGAGGNPRKFGSRRHYCFSHLGYRTASAKIVTALAQRYGKHPAITAWQTDNEYGCHDTIVSYSGSAALAFRTWLKHKYNDIAALNKAWGTVFWSMEYRSFDEVDPPHLTVTEPQPSHVLDYRRFASDEVVSYNLAQVAIIRQYAPDADIMHNFMGFFTEFDHHAVGAGIDVAGWDSYPLGFLEQFFFSEEEKTRFALTGHPDIAAFHHDLYRGTTKNGRWWVAEQQPGPVNWAGYNPAPLPGMVRLWTLEAMAHGAELVSYFRWRQAPFAQEQMHSGLLRPDSSEDVGAHEARQVCTEIKILGNEGARKSAAALVFDYESIWASQIQPQGKNYNPLELAFRCYSALRKRGLDVDIISKNTPIDDYQLVAIPCLALLDDATATRLNTFKGELILGPRSGSKTMDFHIPAALAPGALQSLIPFKVTRLESLRPGLGEKGRLPNGDTFVADRWMEHVDCGADVSAIATLDNGRPAALRSGKVTYLTVWPDNALWDYVIEIAADSAGMALETLTDGLVCRRLGGLRFAFNYGPEAKDLRDYITDFGEGTFLVGSYIIAATDVAIWREV
jgi:beta-galactosidase